MCLVRFHRFCCFEVTDENHFAYIVIVVFVIIVGFNVFVVFTVFINNQLQHHKYAFFAFSTRA